MRRTPLAAVALVFAAALAGAPSTQAKHLEDQYQPDQDWSRAETSYFAAYEKAESKLGLAAVGRNVVLDGWHENGQTREATPSEVQDATERLRAAIAPPPPPTPTETSYAAESSYVPSGSYGYASDATAMCESGGDPTTNTGNGFYGAYQFDSGTWDAYGDPAYAEASDAPMSVQAAAAASVPYDAWPNC